MALKPVNTWRKQFQIDATVLAALESVLRETRTLLERFADELRDFCRNHRRPLNLKDAWRDSTRTLPANGATSNTPVPKTSPKRSALKTKGATHGQASS